MYTAHWIKMKTGIDIPEEVIRGDKLLSSDHRPGYDDIPIILANIPTIGFRCVYTKSYEDLIVPERSPFPGKTRINQSLQLLKQEDIEEAILWCLPAERYIYCLPSVFENRPTFLKILRNAIHKHTRNHSDKSSLVWLANTIYHGSDWNDEVLEQVKIGSLENVRFYNIEQPTGQPSIDNAVSHVLKEALLYG